MGIRSQDKPDRKGSKKVKHKSICNDIERKRNTKPMAG